MVFLWKMILTILINYSVREQAAASIEAAAFIETV